VEGHDRRRYEMVVAVVVAAAVVVVAIGDGLERPAGAVVDQGLKMMKQKGDCG
jgi:hypothetical protein